MSDKKAYIGVVTSAHYNATVKAIRLEIEFENKRINKFEWPVTMFKFKPEQDVDVEMDKTARLLWGKKIRVVIDDN